MADFEQGFQDGLEDGANGVIASGSRLWPAVYREGYSDGYRVGKIQAGGNRELTW